MPGKVVIGIDESEHAVDAFNFYMTNIHKDGNELLLVNCIEAYSMIGEVPSVDLYEGMMDKSKQKAKALEDKFENLLKAKHVHGKIMALFGSKPGELIVETATKENATLIICGSRGHGKFRRTVLGSVSDYVIHHAKCPVIVCRK